MEDLLLLITEINIIHIEEIKRRSELEIAINITKFFVKKRWIEPEQSSWFCYCIEKKLLTTFISIPAFGLALYLAGFWPSIIFFGSYFYLRSYANGFHANSPLICFILSLILEIFFLGIVYPAVTAFPLLSWILNGINLILIILLAPFNHPKMHLTTEELKGCRKILIRRVVVLLFLIYFMWIIKFRLFFYSLTTGFAMVVFLLTLAYIIESKEVIKRWIKKGSQTIS